MYITVVSHQKQTACLALYGDCLTTLRRAPVQELCTINARVQPLHLAASPQNTAHRCWNCAAMGNKATVSPQRWALFRQIETSHTSNPRTLTKKGWSHWCLQIHQTPVAFTGSRAPSAQWQHTLRHWVTAKKSSQPSSGQNWGHPFSDFSERAHGRMEQPKQDLVLQHYQYHYHSASQASSSSTSLLSSPSSSMAVKHESCLLTLWKGSRLSKPSTWGNF